MELQKVAEKLNLDETVRCELERVIQYEQEERRRRQAEGIARAKARGVRFGRPCVKVRGLEHVYTLYSTNQISVTEAAKLCGIPRSTMYRKLCEYSKRDNKAG